MQQYIFILCGALISAVLLLPVPSMGDKIYIGDRPDIYRPVNAAAIQHLNDQSSSMTTDQFGASVTETIHPVTALETTKGTNTETFMASVVPSIPVAPIAANITGVAVALASHASSKASTTSKAVGLNEGNQKCPPGWVSDTALLFPFISCQQDCYDARNKWWVRTDFAINQDGSPVVYSPAVGPAYGVVAQQVYGDDGQCKTYNNLYVADALDLQYEAISQEQFGGVITYQGQAPDPDAGYQLQVYLPPVNKPDGTCATQTERHFTQSVSCQ